MHLETRVLVTGGAGFLGSHLCERLLALGANVICADNYFTGTKRNIDSMLDHHRASYTGRCRKTTRASASPILRKPKRRSAGYRRPRYVRGSCGPLAISKRC